MLKFLYIYLLHIVSFIKISLKSYLGIVEHRRLAWWEVRLDLFLNSFSHSSIVSGRLCPAVSGKNRDRNADNNALIPNIVVGIATWYSANFPTMLDKTPPILATREHEPNAAFLKG